MSSQNRSKMGKAFAKMTTACPQQIAGYGMCLHTKSATGLLERDACDEHFKALKRCFQQAAKGVKATR
ncbi:unnamed protein product [Hapterophycus canaliculatus]